MPQPYKSPLDINHLKETPRGSTLATSTLGISWEYSILLSFGPKLVYKITTTKKISLKEQYFLENNLQIDITGAMGGSTLGPGWAPAHPQIFFLKIIRYKI